jgi:hypothetical protein
MEASISEVAGAIRRILTEVAEEAAQRSGCVRRRRKLTGAGLVQALTLSVWEQPQSTWEGLAQGAASVGVAISPQGLAKRCTERAAACLQAVLEAAVAEVMTAAPVTVPVLERFSAVVVQDSTTVALPDSLAEVWSGCGERTGQGQAALKLQVRLDLRRGQLTGPQLVPGRSGDKDAALQTEPLPAGALRLADLGYFSLAVLADLSAQQVFWLSRLQVQTAVCAPTGERRDLTRWLPRRFRRAGAVGLDEPIRLGAAHQLPARLLALPVPPAVAAERRRKLRAQARRKGQTVSRARLAGAAWTILVTNVPAELLTIEEAVLLYRARWQIELLFKLWKQDGCLEGSRSRQPWRILCEVYAKLLAAVLQHWCALVGCWTCPERSLVKAAQVIRRQVPLLAAACAGRCPWTLALDQIAACLASGRRIARSRRKPSTAQRLLALPPYPAAGLSAVA